MNRVNEADASEPTRAAPHVDFGESETCRACAGPVYLPDLIETDDLPLCTAHWNRWLTRFLGANDAPPCSAHLVRESTDSAALS